MGKFENTKKRSKIPRVTSIPIALLLLVSPISVKSSYARSHLINNHINLNTFGLGGEGDPLFEDDFSINPNSNTNSISMCLPNYEVSEGSIIRTKDSVDLGARFLNESDLGVNGREECLRLCCRTPYCNVAVFQEKSSGSCYMFDCGSPEDFRCKFTSQIQYMSAILRKKVIPVSPNVQHSNTNIHNGHNNDIGHNQHEAELSQLRGRNDDVEKGNSKNNSPIVNRKNPNGGGENGNPPTTLASFGLGPFESNSRRCSRWQFECKSSGECIAIYNACDGIPNCSDASDEAPDLHCPSVIGPMPPPNKHQNVQQSTSGNHQSSGTFGNEGPLDTGKVVGIGMDVGNINGNGQQLKEYSVLQNQQQPVVPIPGKVNDHIFNHKDGGVMEQNYGNQLQQQKHLNPFLKQGYDYNNGEQLPNSGFGQGYLSNSQTNNGAYGGPGMGNGNVYGLGSGTNGQYPYAPGYPNQQSGNMMAPEYNPNQGNSFPIPQIQPQYYGTSNKNSINNGLVSNPDPNLDKGQLGKQSQIPNFLPQGSNLGLPSSVQNPVGNGGPNQGGSDNRNSPGVLPVTTMVPKLDGQPNIVTTSSPETKANQQKPNLDNKSKQSAVEDSEAKVENDILKSLKNQPYNSEAESAAIHLEELSPHKAGPGAFFLFIVGLGMSIVMAVIVGCRLRRISVGARRRRKNRLDPDYLVDGMYL